MKVARHEKIIELIHQYDIDTQEELASRLNEAGFKVTQATVSRDIRALKLTKVAGKDGKSRYAIINNESLGMVRQWQELFYKHNYSSTSMTGQPDFVKLAEAYGHVGIRITDLKDLKPKMEEAFAMKDRLVFLDIQVDVAEHVYPMQIKDGSMRDMWLNKTERT